MGLRVTSNNQRVTKSALLLKSVLSQLIQFKPNNQSIVLGVSQHSVTVDTGTGTENKPY